MAIFPPQPTAARSSTAPLRETQPIDVEAWTEEATASLWRVTISPPLPTRGTSAPLAIPLDEHPQTAQRPQTDLNHADTSDQPTTPRRKLLRRDSLDRRNALLKGKEGSRRRQRWENDHLLSNPHAVPPLPTDFLPHPTHPQRSVPYFLAPFWDARPTSSTTSTSAKPQDPLSRVPTDLRATLKKAKAAKGLLQDLEEEVRRFVVSWERKQALLREKGLHDVGSDSEDEEIVFVGRGGAMLDAAAKNSRAREEESVNREKLVFDSLATDRGASFGRWLVHNIATYYDLRTWSVTRGDPARREAYVGIKAKSGGVVPGTAVSGGEGELPRPLWGMV